MTFRARLADWQTVARMTARYVAAVAAGNLVWEFAQLPLFTLWRTAQPAYLTFVALHCWLGDLLIALSCLALGIAVAGHGWPRHGYRRVAVVSVLLGLGYTVFSEWMNVTVRGSWAYAPSMPRLPPFGTGLSPFLQWLVIPTVAFVVTRPRGGTGWARGSRRDRPARVGDAERPFDGL